MGLICHHLPFGPVSNLFAQIGDTGPHFCFAGHTDVVPPGAEENWTYPPFSAAVHDGILYGRGAVDMKGGIGAFAGALAAYLEKHGQPPGSISLMITGDEEADRIDGTVKILPWMKDHNHLPDVCVIGEPTNPQALGEQIKIGRRGSFTGYLSVKGKQGHVAYPHLADNPLPRLIRLVDRLCGHEWDGGSDFFPPTNLEISTVDVGNTVDNLIPAAGRATFNIRFSDHWSGQTLDKAVRALLDAEDLPYELETIVQAESIFTPPGEFTTLMADAVHDVTGRVPDLTTEGGISDSYFIGPYCPAVAEFGLMNATAHHVDEHVRTEDITMLSQIYLRMLERFFGR
jgi:succinyl-diaminopimelate desuccinylase